jgi:hypothetical protein
MAKKPGTSLKHLEAYRKLMSVIPGLEIRGAKMPYVSVNGHMFSFLKEKDAGLRLPLEMRVEFIRKFGSGLYVAFGTTMKEYVTIPGELLGNVRELKPFVASAFQYASSLKPKPTAGRKRKK